MSRNWSKFCLDEHSDGRGTLGVLELSEHPEVKRVFFITDVSDMPTCNGRRGHHAVRHAEIIICAQGSCLVSLGDGVTEQEQMLRKFEGLRVHPYVWIQLRRFEPGTVLCVLAEKHFAESEYIRDYEEWKTCVAAKT